MQYLVIFQPRSAAVDKLPPADFKTQQAKELAQGQALYAQGVLRQSWEIDTPRNGAVCLFEAESAGDLQGMIDSLPHVQTGFVEVQVYPLKPDPAYTQGV